ncbi:bifunctional serine/threonine-protein kinase/ABC transporter substrate-binding protein [Streptomyces sp. MAR4 CNX-425]|uniref:bifunctional serine/threonine-protein kinase/ABC transporter substrate-binding protein n=1 Tax=Streptomyces sp. MAR4 CNX-425 TaxID=3406343 RepID=UPI003B4FFAC4
MRPLRADDPDELGGHTLLARLGTGGMGVVYLARGGDGALVALKVIRPEHAANPAFRARFRREVRLATGLTGRWVVPVTAADAEARAPWLATAFVPGPALVEAVDGYGPLPRYAVAALGARLAEALAEVHAAGLVHRDVKPGNVLLTLDGPRLIDFGIAHDAGATALTAPDAVVGTPGYLAPEQIRAGGRAGPPSDVFALGCVLAYAATGRRPYGTGDPAAVLYRTVHEEPDLAGLERLPRGLRTAVADCLAKAAGDRPTAAELARVLAAEGPSRTPERAAGAEPPPAGAGAVDPRVPAPPPPDAATRVLRDEGAPAAETLPYGPDGDGDEDGGGTDADGGGTDADGGNADGGGAEGDGGADGRTGGGPAAGHPATVPTGDASAPDRPGADPRTPPRPPGVRAGDGPGDPAPGAPAAAPPAAAGEWLPSPVLRLVAERSARALDPPPRQPVPRAGAVPPPPEGTTTASPPSRRRFLVVGGSAAAALAASGAGAAVLFAARGGSDDGGGAAPDPPTHVIGLHAALTGERKADGVAHERGARLAVARHNARDDARFRLSLAPYDDRGEADRARDVARRVLDEGTVSAVLGPTTVASLRAAVPLYGEESMAAVDVSVDADAAGVSTSDVQSLVVTRLSGSYHHHPTLDYLTRVRGVTRTAVVEDREGGDTARDMVRSLRDTPPGEGEIGFHPVAASEGFEAAVDAALAARPEAVVYAGTSPERAAACARAVAGAGFSGPRTSYEMIMRPAFLRAAGAAGEGWVFGAPYTAVEQQTAGAARDFTAAYRERYDGTPPRWAAEAYDAVNLIAAALDALGGGAGILPGQVAERIVELKHAGVAKPLTFVGGLLHLLSPERAAFLYEVRDGAFRLLGRHDLVE